MFTEQWLYIETVKGQWVWPHNALEGAGIAYRYLNGICTLTHIKSGLSIVSTHLECEADARELTRRVARLADWHNGVVDMQKIARRRHLKEKIKVEIERCTGWLELPNPGYLLDSTEGITG